MKKIELTKYDKKIIRLCKGMHPYKKGGTIIDLMKRYYKSHYAIDPDEYTGWKGVMFDKLFSVFMKIRENNGSMNHMDISHVFFASFEKGLSRDQEEPVERAIAELYGQIQGTKVRNKIPNGRWRRRFDWY